MFGDNSYIYNTYSAAGEKLTTQCAVQALPVLSPLSGNGGTGKITILSTNMPSDKTDTERLNNIDSKETHYIFEIDNLRFQDNIIKGIYRFKYNFK